MSKPYKLIKAPGLAPLSMQFHDWFTLPVNPETFEDYRQDAKRIIDSESKNMKPIGLQMLVAAMIDLLESDYSGKHNQGIMSKAYVEKTPDDILAEVI